MATAKKSIILGEKKMSPCTLEELEALLLATWRKVFSSARIFHERQTKEEGGFQIHSPMDKTELY